MQKQIIYIVENNKNELIKNKSNNNLQNNKYYTLKEIRENLYYRYNAEAILYLVQKYHIKEQIAKIYLNNLYHIENKDYQNTKLNQLVTIKQDLLTNKIITTNPFFIPYIKNKHIIFHGEFSSPDINIVKEKLQKYTTVSEESSSSEGTPYKHNIYTANSLNDEVTFLACQIGALLKNGVSPKNIFITNLDDEYRNAIQTIFPFFNIPINLNITQSIYSTTTVQEFLKNYGTNPLDALPKKDSPIKEHLIKILNDYIWAPDYQLVKPLIIEDIKNTSLRTPKLDNAINEISLTSSITDNDYLFLPNFNQGTFPIITKDEDYLTDAEKRSLGLLTSIEINKINYRNAYNKIIHTKNLTISYKKHTLNDTYYISSLNTELNYPIILIPNPDLNLSHLYNKITLTNELDNFNKFGSISDELLTLNTNYPKLPYRTYDNTFKGLETSYYQNSYQDGLSLSYSSMDTYYRCGFRYYLDNILKVNIYEDTFMQNIGNIFHQVLEKSFPIAKDYETTWQNALNEYWPNPNAKEKFFLKKLKEELKYIIDTIKEQNDLTLLKNELHEERIAITYDGKIKITFKGFIDKIKYQEFAGETVVAIIDYKTGNPNLNLNNAYYGIEMQLPVYLFLAKNSSKILNVRIAGFYLQKILNNEIVKDQKLSYDTQKKKNLYLQGYSNDNIDIISKFDPSYADSKMIKSLKTTSKGFAHYSKILNEKTMNQLIDLVENKITAAKEDITNGLFPINPKKIGKNNYGCEFCTYKDVCFMQEKDIVKLKEYKNLEFLGGDDNA